MLVRPPLDGTNPNVIWISSGCIAAFAAVLKESARGLAHSKTLRANPMRQRIPRQRFGLRRPSAAFERGFGTRLIF
jgi:hypothetical protein